MTQMSMTVLGCADCDVSFAVSDDFVSRRRVDHKNFYCPRGHINYFPKPKIDKVVIEKKEKAKKKKVKKK